MDKSSALCFLALLVAAGCGRDGQQKDADRGKQQARWGFFEIRKAQTVPGEGYVQAIARGAPPVYVHQDALIVAQDITKALPDYSAKPMGLALKLSPEGAARLRRFTAESVGKLIAVLIDGEVLAMPEIPAELPPPSGVIMVKAEWTRQELEDIVRRLNQR